MLHQQIKHGIGARKSVAEVFLELEQVVIGEVGVVCVSVFAVLRDLIMQVAVRKDPVLAGFIDREQHPVRECGKTALREHVRSPVQEQDLRELMIEARMRDAGHTLMPVIRDKPAAEIGLGMIILREILEKVAVAAERIPIDVRGEAGLRKEQQICKFRIKARIKETGADAVLTFEPCTARQRRPAAVIALLGDHGIEHGDAEVARRAGRTCLIEKALDHIGGSIAEENAVSGRDVGLGGGGVVAVEAPAAVAGVAVTAPERRNAVACPVDAAAVRNGQEGEIRCAAALHARRAERQPPAVFRLVSFDPAEPVVRKLARAVFTERPDLRRVAQRGKIAAG